jgi:hypothetical protein
MCSKGTFSDLQDTWSRKTSLQENDYDPFPELAPEAYCTGCKDYQTQGSSVNYSGPQARMPMKEKFCDGRPRGTYNTLGKTWSNQKDYSL